MKWSKNGIKYVAYAVWLVWALSSIGLLLSFRADGSFSLLYVAYVIFSGVMLRITRHDLLQPPGVFTLACFLAFGLSLPLVYTGNRTIATSDTTLMVLSDEALFRALVIILFAQASFIGGFYSRLHRFLSLRWFADVPLNSRRASLPIYVVLVVIIFVAAVIRIELHLGEAGQQPSVPFAGYLQYALFDGVLLATLWFLAQGLRQSRLYVVLGLSLLGMMAIAQALLGWRGGIIQMIYVAIGLFWYQTQYRQHKRPYAFAWLLVLVLSASALIQLGNETRVSRLGGKAQFANSTTELVEKIAYRSQGTTRLAVITEHFGPITLFNNFLINDLLAEGLTTTTYIDRTLYSVRLRQSHSVGTSGPGGAYVAMGLVGVIGMYFMLGIFYGCVYSGVIGTGIGRNNIIYVVLYSYLMFSLAGALSENLGTAFLKNLTAVFVAAYVLKVLIARRST